MTPGLHYCRRRNTQAEHPDLLLDTPGRAVYEDADGTASDYHRLPLGDQLVLIFGAHAIMHISSQPLRRLRLLHEAGLSIVALVYCFSRSLGVHKREGETHIRYSERISQVLQHHLPHQLLTFFLSPLRRRPLCTYTVCNISENTVATPLR